MDAIAKRICRAYDDHQEFRVIIVMPLKPEFHGDWDGSLWNGLLLREVTRLNLATLFKGDNSLKKRLENHGGW